MNTFRLLVIFTVIAGFAITVTPASAYVLDLTSAGASGWIGDAWFKQVADQSTGTGVIDPFLRVQHAGSEMGVNSDGPYTMDEKSGIWTHSIGVNEFGVVPLNGADYIRVLLDVNQTNHDPLLSLDQLKVFVAPSADYNTLADLYANGDLLYDMGANQVFLDYSLDSGSGAGDMLAYLPYSLFSSHTDEYFYLFSEFGATGGNYVSNDGFEEWARVDGNPPTPPVPEPTTLLLLGGGLLATAIVRRRTK